MRPENNVSGLAVAPTGQASAAPAPAAPAARTGGRLLFVDNLRVALTVLVVIHHLAVTYLAPVGWYYLEPSKNPAAGFVGLAFLLLNQGYFMGLFFFVSGAFTPRSYDRRGAGAFVRDRLLRLGVPLAVFVLAIGELAVMAIWFTPYAHHPTSFLNGYVGGLGVGPLWFVETLLVFVILYAVWRRAARPAPVVPLAEPSPPAYRTVGLYVLALAVVTFLWRIVSPLGFTVPVLGLPTAAYLPQYASFFVLGLVAYRRGWLQGITDRMGRAGWIAALASFLLLFLPAVLSSSKGEMGGHGTWQSALYALWDSVFAVGMSLGLLTFFRRRLNTQGPVRRFMSANAFGVYLLHALVIAWLGVALRGLPVDPAVKFPIAIVLGVPLSFAVAALVRRIPGVRRIL